MTGARVAEGTARLVATVCWTWERPAIPHPVFLAVTRAGHSVLWIMIIAARSGVSGVAISKVHAAYSLGASKWQILSKVIVPNSLPDIFTGARVAMGVCWGTVVAAELVAANVGLGKMIVTASKFQLTDIIIVGIIVIGVIGFAIEVGMRALENWLIPWKGKV